MLVKDGIAKRENVYVEYEGHYNNANKGEGRSQRLVNQGL